MWHVLIWFAIVVARQLLNLTLLKYRNITNKLDIDTDLINSDLIPFIMFEQFYHAVVC